MDKKLTNDINPISPPSEGAGDNFGKLIKDKLENHQLQVDDNCWPEIEERLHNNKRTRVIPLWTWISGAVVVAAVFLLFIFPPFTAIVESGNIVEQTEQIPAEREKQISEVAVETIIIKEHPRPTGKSAAKNEVVFEAKATADEKKSEPKTEINEHTEDNVMTDTSKEGFVETYPRNTEEKAVEREKHEKTKETELPEYNPYDNVNTNWPPRKKEKKRNNWLVAASVNAGGRSLSNKQQDMSSSPLFYEKGSDHLESPDGMDAVVPDESKGETEQPNGGEDAGSDVKDSYLKALENHNFSSVTHLPPLSFGIRIRKDFNKYFALESGLNYTYLSSKFTDSQPLKREATLNMHYLGLPLNAVVYFTDKPKWNVYFLAGGMVEKGIWSTYREKSSYSQNEYRNTSDSDHIDGLQWSLNASVGIGYNFYRNFSIYFEPNITYYLNNNQPLSARTENQLIVGLNAGIRYCFN